MARGPGTMTERSPGVWTLRVYSGRDKDDKVHHVNRTFKGGKRDAEKALAALVTDVAERGAPLTGTTTVAKLLDDWLNFIAAQREPGTIRGYRDCIRRIKASSLGRIKVSKLTAQHLDRAYKAWEEQGLSATTIQHTHSVLRAALNQAVRWGLIPRAVTGLARPPKPQIAPPSAPTVDMVQQLVVSADEANRPVLAAAIALAAMTGCRRGELCGLRWSDIESDSDGHPLLHIQRAAKNSVTEQGQPRKIEIRDTKTHQSRKLAIDNGCMAVLTNHRARVEKWATEAGVEVLPNGYILSFDPSGAEPMHPDSLTQAFDRLRDRLRLDVRFHDLRHFTATQLLGAGYDPVTVAGRLGHRDPSITMRVYAAVLEEKDREAAEFIGTLVTGPLTKQLPAAG